MILPLRIGYPAIYVYEGHRYNKGLIMESVSMPVNHIDQLALTPVIHYYKKDKTLQHCIVIDESTGRFYKALPKVRVGSEDYPVSRFLMLNHHAGSRFRQENQDGILVSPCLDDIAAHKVTLTALLKSGGHIADPDYSLRRRQKELDNLRKRLQRMTVVGDFFMNNIDHPSLRVTREGNDRKIVSLRYVTVTNDQCRNDMELTEFPLTDLDRAKAYASSLDPDYHCAIDGELEVLQPALVALPGRSGSRP